MSNYEVTLTAQPIYVLVKNARDAEHACQLARDMAPSSFMPDGAAPLEWSDRVLRDVQGQFDYVIDAGDES